MTRRHQFVGASVLAGLWVASTIAAAASPQDSEEAVVQEAPNSPADDREGAAELDTIPVTTEERPANVARPAPKRTATLEEIVVTAQKRDQNLQEVPITVTAFSAEALQDHEINNIEDVAKLVPALKYTTQFDVVNSSLRIRGVGTEVVAPTVEPNVSVVVDGVPLARTEQVNFEFADVERIEVLRGPQGTLFGKNASAGAIQVVTSDPSPEVKMTFRSSYEAPQHWPGSQSTSQFSVSGPLGGSTGGRISAFYKRIEGHLNDIEQAEHAPDSDAYGARGKLRWDISEDLVARMIVETQQLSGASMPFVFRSVNEQQEAAHPEIHYGPENRDAKTLGVDSLKLDGSAFTGSLAWNADAFTLTSVTGLRYLDLHRTQSAPQLYRDKLDLIRATTDREYLSLSQELRLESSFDDSVDYTLGVLFFNTTADSQSLSRVENVPVSLAAGGSITLPTIPGEGILSRQQTSDGGATTRNIGVFAHSIWHISDTWRLTTGARFIDEKQTAHAYRDERVSLQATETPLTSESERQPDHSITDQEVIGTASLQYSWAAADTIAFLTISSGYRGGAIDILSGDLAAAFADPVRPERSFNIEIGTKSRFFDNRLELNMGLFRTVFKDFQAQIVDVQNGGLSVGVDSEFSLANAGQLTTEGLEIDLRARPFDALTLTASYLHNLAVFDEFIAPCFVGQQVGERGGQDLDGNGSCDVQDVSGGSLPNAPRDSASVSARYDFVHESGSTTYVQLSGSWQSDVIFDTAQHPLLRQEAYSLWNLRAGWRGLGDRLEIAGYVSNLFSQFYVGGQFPLSVVNDRNDVIHFPPRDADRQFGVSISYSY